MRIPPNPHPAIRIRSTLLTVICLLGVWALLSLTGCGAISANPAQMTPPSLDHRSATAASRDLRRWVTRFAPMGPIPLTRPLAPMRKRTWWRV